MTPTSSPKTVYLKDYTPPAYLIPKIDLFFNLLEDKTIVTAKTMVKKNQATSNSAPLVLDGEHMILLEIKINDLKLDSTQYTLTSEQLTIHQPPASDFEMEIKTELKPQDNKSFVGLYKTKTIYCTQMEAQGFRRVTYFLDRPDVLAKYTTTIEADAKTYPHLLSNGDRTKQETVASGRHRVTWSDPFPKPCYLFALVAGDLGLVKDVYKTVSGKTVALEIYTDKGNESRCAHAMESLKQSMKWDEDTYGLEYDLNIYMIVAVDDFNMGAMENKGLNIFNTKFVLADEKTATDNEFMGVQTVIAHEYFHNWSGNRVTCRDWFQLSLKEGLTVFRDQEFSSDLNSRGVKRIEDVNNLRARQFPEDASGMAHPIRPASYMAIDNFYTRTVYDKGAEVIRMLQTLLGRELFIKGVQKYFEMFDGQAVTTDDFIKAHEITSGRDLPVFKNWYDQAGTPTVRVREHYDAEKKQLTLWLQQETVNPVTKQANKAYQIPIKYAAFTAQGTALPITLLKGAESAPGVLDLSQDQQEFIFKNVTEKPVLSLLREFSAPIKMEYEQNDQDLLLLMAKDTDPFCRYEAAQKLYTKAWLKCVQQSRENKPLSIDSLLFEAMRKCLTSVKTEDHAFLAKLLSPPSVSYFLQFCADENPLHVENTFRYFVESVQKNLGSELQSTWDYLQTQTNLSVAKKMDLRALKGVILFYVTFGTAPAATELLQKEYSQSQTMTDVMNVLMSATHKTNCKSLFNDFYQKWKDDALVMNKWFAAQALSLREDCLENVQKLLTHPSYDKTNPNKIFALIFSFISLNPLRFHREDGAGYQFAADQILDIDSRNPQVASRMATCFNDWSRWAPGLKSLAKKQIERIHQTPGVSKNVFEIMERALKMG